MANSLIKTVEDAYHEQVKKAYSGLTNNILSAQGNPEEIEKAKNTFSNALKQFGKCKETAIGVINDFE